MRRLVKRGRPTDGRPQVVLTNSSLNKRHPIVEVTRSAHPRSSILPVRSMYRIFYCSETHRLPFTFLYKLHDVPLPFSRFDKTITVRTLCPNTFCSILSLSATCASAHHTPKKLLLICTSIRDMLGCAVGPRKIERHI